MHYCQQCLLLLILPFQVSEIKRAHVRGLLHAFKVPTQSILRTQQQANEQASKYYQHGKIQIHSRTRPNEVVIVVCAVSSVQSMLVTVPLFNNLYIKYWIFTLTCVLLLLESESRKPGQIEDLCDLLAEDWVSLGSVREMGDATQRFFQAEMEKLWGEKHLSVFSEDEAKKWVLGVRTSSTSWSLSKAVRFRSASWSTSTSPYFTIFFQAVRLLRVSANLEAKANAMRREALQCITVALAGSDTKKLWELMTAYFGTAQKQDDDNDPWDFLDAAPAIPEPLPLTETDTEDEATSTKSTPAASVAPKPTGAAKRKPQVSLQKDLLPDVCSPKEAIRIYPADENSVNETGIPAHLQVKREQHTTGKGGSVYLCLHEKCQMPTFWAQSPAGLYSHMRRKHLGVVIACPYCPDKLYWNSKGWKSHMEHQHRHLPAYRSALQDEAAVAQEMLASMKKQASSKSPAKKRRRASALKVKSEPVEESSSATSDSSPDSATSSDSDTESEKPTGKPASAQPTEEQDPLADLPPLEEKAPPKFPEHAKSGSRKRKKPQL